MSEVVMHPRAAEGQARQARRELEGTGIVDEQRAAFEERIRRRALLAHAEARMKERPLMHRSEERRSVGESLWCLLEEIENGPRGVSKARVLQEAIHATRIDSTKHLPRYAVRPSDDPAVAERRARHLLKTAEKFVQIARVAANLGGLDPDSAVLRILEGTYYTQDPPQASVAEDLARRTAAVSAMLAHIASRLCKKHPVEAAMRRMEAAGWTLRAPGDLMSSMQVDPALIGRKLDLPQTSFCTDRELAKDSIIPLSWVELERYPHLHLGYVSNELVGASTFGRVAGAFHFEFGGGKNFNTDFLVFDVCCAPAFRVDLILVPDPHGAGSHVMWALNPVTWIKTTKRLSWTAPDGAEHWIGQEEFLGEIATIVLKKEKSSLIDPCHGLTLNGSYLPQTGGSWRGSLMLLTNEEGQVTSDIRPAGLQGLTSLNSIKEFQRQSDVAFLSLVPFLTLFDQTVLHRQFLYNPWIVNLWTDERPTGMSYVDHPLAAEPMPAAPALDPVEAPEGSLSARLERWLQGALTNRGTFEEDFEAAVVAFMARIDATASGARERLATAVYGKR